VAAFAVGSMVPFLFFPYKEVEEVPKKRKKSKKKSGSENSSEVRISAADKGDIRFLTTADGQRESTIAPNKM